MKVVESVQKGDELCFVKGISGSLGGEKKSPLRHENIQ